MGIVIIGALFVDIKGTPFSQYVRDGRNAGKVVEVHGGVSRNVAEDIANVELRPTFISVTDHSALGKEVVEKLKRHKCNTDYIVARDGGLGTWLAIFDNEGEVVASISQRPDLSVLHETFKKHGDEIFKNCDSIALEIDLDADLLREIFNFAKKYHKDVYAVVSNMSIAMQRRDLMMETACLVCNQEEAGLLFSKDYCDYSREELALELKEKVRQANYSKMVVTMGDKGAVYADRNGDYGICNAQRTAVVDTTGAGDAFFAGVTIGLTYHKSLKEACEIGTRLASAVIATNENVSPRFRPEEFDLEIE